MCIIGIEEKVCPNPNEGNYCRHCSSFSALHTPHTPTDTSQSDISNDAYGGGRGGGGGGNVPVRLLRKLMIKCNSVCCFRIKK
ncbi:unnamed protein product [Mesocestoides corti]|uniref:Uncharacterized protein n=1 Tax=Mesocestoides corti TaxID=53468 RepID=A0A0R3UI67_MESCO|nr:unnamed protein product [Mesocestoides corti]